MPLHPSVAEEIITWRGQEITHGEFREMADTGRITQIEYHRTLGLFYGFNECCVNNYCNLISLGYPPAAFMFYILGHSHREERVLCPECYEKSPSKGCEKNEYRELSKTQFMSRYCPDGEWVDPRTAVMDANWINRKEQTKLRALATKPGYVGYTSIITNFKVYEKNLAEMTVYLADKMCSVNLVITREETIHGLSRRNEKDLLIGWTLMTKLPEDTNLNASQTKYAFTFLWCSPGKTREGIEKPTH